MKILVQANDDGKHHIDFKPVFERLNKELSKIGQSLELVCAGGYVMQLHGYRATLDVDAFYRSNKQIDDIIRKIGEEFGINKEDELWLNNSISNMNNAPPDEHCKPLYNFSNLVVKVVDIIYLIGMKLESPREQDLHDVATILKSENMERLFELQSDLQKMRFTIDISDLLEAFGLAHGMEWLKVFYENNEDKINMW